MKQVKVLVSFLLIIVFAFVDSSCKKEDEAEPDKSTYSENAPEGYKVYETQSQKFWLDTIAMGLDKPWGMTFTPDGDILFSERAGKLFIIRNSSGVIEEISGLPPIASVGQGGLLDLLLHPNYKSNGWLYFSYSKLVGNRYTTAVSRARISGNSLVDHEELFEASPAFSTTHHFGCRLVIQDGYLFFGVGDRGQMKQAQMLDRHNGKIMRLNDDGSVPSDNPFVATADAKAEIWSYGHRNPQGLSLNPLSNELWEHEHGPKGGDELNIVKKGANFGWPEITYGIDYDGSVISNETHKDGMEQPVTYWVPSIAPCGMAFCNSSKYPAWKNNVFIGGLVSTALFRVELNGDTYVSQEKMLDGIGRVRNVVLSPDGFLYITLESPGFIFRLAPIND